MSVGHRHPPVIIHLPVSLHHHGRLHGPSLDLDHLRRHSFCVVTDRGGVGRLLARASGCWRGISEHPLIGWAWPALLFPQSRPQVVSGIYSSVSLRLTCVGSHMTASTSDRSLIEPQTQPARPFVNQPGPPLLTDPINPTPTLLYCLPLNDISSFLINPIITFHQQDLPPCTQPHRQQPLHIRRHPFVCLLSPACRHHGLQTAPFGRPEGIRRDY